MTREELDKKLLNINPDIFIAGTTGGIQLIMNISAFGSYISWSVHEGDHVKHFPCYNEAAEYYLKVEGDTE